MRHGGVRINISPDGMRVVTQHQGGRQSEYHSAVNPLALI